MNGALTLSDREFKKFATLVYDRTGINLNLGKKSLLQGRVNKVLRKRGINSYKEYYSLITADKSETELIGFINLISTNVTHFFREEKHFEYLRDPWATEMAGEGDTVEVWSAASSSGEEPYSLAIELAEILKGRPYTILGSDISTRVLNTAERGVYTMEKLKMIPKHRLHKYFQKGAGKSEGYARVKKELRDRVSFRVVNLIKDFPFQKKFDLIVCRNVMIYFDTPVKNGIISRLQRHLKPGGTLFIGHSETLNGLEHSLQYIAPAIYRKQ
ncbi:MAG: protein-glutamate O-methyltransferase [Candidatus Cloacimonetes bacterium]|nr:protein-glutamate O-methyltransferase [Candidatus Cloacimonadota bacterium]